MNLDPRLLRYLRRVRVALVLAISLGLLAGVLLVAQAYLLSQTISRVFLDGQDLRDVRDLLIALAGVAAARALALWGGEIAAAHVAGRIKADLRESQFAHIMALGPAYTRGERSGELTATLTDGIEALDAYFSQYIPQVALSALLPLVMLFLIFPLDVLSGVVLLLTAPMIPFFMVLIGSLADAQSRRQWALLSRLSAHFLDVLQGLTTLKLFGRSRAQIEEIARISDQFRDATMSVLRIAFLSAFALEMLATISTAIIAVEIGLRLLYGRMAFGEALFILILAPEYYAPLRMLGARFHAGTAGTAAAQRIFEVLSAPASLRTQNVGAYCNTPLQGTPSEIHFEDIHYAYPGGDRPALDGVSFAIPAGQKIALVGRSGAGKSTIAQLLLRFIEPTGGRISVNGIELAAIPADMWRDQVAWVPQMPYLFAGSVADNIRLARPDAPLDDVIRAAEQAHADSFIRALPDGYNKLIGERGARLSGGQAQRIALARAFLKDAPLLILDEATSNLDPDTEAEIQAAIHALMQQRTVLIIAHRLNTVRDADQIVVLDEGRVVEMGTHAALIGSGGVYSGMLSSQRSAFSSQPPAVSTEIGAGRVQVSRYPSLEPHATAGEVTKSATGTLSPRVASTLACRGSVGEVNHFKRLLRLAAPFKGWMLLSALLGFLTIGSSIGLMSAAAWIIASAALHPPIGTLNVAIVGVRFFGIARGVFRYLERYVSHQTTFRLLARLRVWFYAQIEPLAPARLSAYHSGDLLARAVSDINTLENFYLRVIAPPVVALIVLVSVAIFTARYDVRLALVLSGCLTLAGIGVPLLVQGLSDRAGRDLVRLRADLNTALIDGVQGLADLLAYGADPRQRDRVRMLSQGIRRRQFRLAAVGALSTALISLITSAAAILILVIAIPLVRSGALDGVLLAVLVLAAITSFEAVQPLPAAFQHLSANLAAARRLFELVDNHGDSVGAYCNTPLQTPFTTPKAEAAPAIHVRDLTFRYGPDEPLALDHISFDLRPGRTLAVVGASGAGKSTLVNLLLRFWDADQGEIRVGGQDVRDLPPDAVRAKLSVVSQQTYLFNATIRDNLLIARPDAQEQDLIRAVQQAQLHDFISGLAQGYDTWIGEQGLRLSGGERQRLAIARALLKDAPILILDEATANLDTVTERAVLQTIHGTLTGRTTLMITHRLVGLDAADEIIVLRASRVVERGRHADLLQISGHYRRLWDQQQGLPQA